jgi:hypothetical protein
MSEGGPFSVCGAGTLEPHCQGKPADLGRSGSDNRPALARYRAGGSQIAPLLLRDVARHGTLFDVILDGGSPMGAPGGTNRQNRRTCSVAHSYTGLAGNPAQRD